MKDMMAALVPCVRLSHRTACVSDRSVSRLKDVTDPKQTTSDGQTIESRIQTLCEAAAEDIRKCANVCDAYLK